MIDILTGLTIGLHVASVHVPAHDGQNNFNPGIYVKHESGWAGGVYRNTIKRTTFWGGYELSHGPLSLTLGVASGYDIRKTTGPCPATAVVEVDTHSRSSTRPGKPEMCEWRSGFSKHKLTPLIAPSVALPTVLEATPRITWVPGIKGRSSNVLHLSIERTF